MSGIRGNVARAGGRGLKMFSGTAAIVGTGTFTVPNGSAVGDAVASVVNSGTALPTDSASITSISGLSINVIVVSQASASNAVETGTFSVSVIAFVS